MKKVTGFYLTGEFFVADIDEAGNLVNIKNSSPNMDWKQIKKGESLLARQPQNGITLLDAYHLTGDYNHTQVFVLPSQSMATPNQPTSDVVVSTIFSNKPDDLIKGSDGANDAIFGDGAW